MNKLIQALCCSITLLSLFPKVMIASTTPDTATEMKVQALTHKEAELQTELNQLREQIANLEQDNLRKVSSTLSSASSKEQSAQPPSYPESTQLQPHIVPVVVDNVSELERRYPSVAKGLYQAAINYIRGITVTTSPIYGLKSAWNASDLVYSIPSMNQDLRLLRHRKHFQKVVEAIGGTLDSRPVVVVSGALESSVAYLKQFSGTNSFDLNVPTAEVDIWVLASSWASSFVTVDFDNSPPQTGARVTNSRLFVQRGFLTIGNLEKSPVYYTMGQMFVPFGRYASAVVTTPITQSLGRIEARAALLGYYKDGFYAEGYAYKGELLPVNGVAFGNVLGTVFQGGANLGYENPHLRIGSLDVGAGFVSNIADSQGMQDTTLNPGIGFPSTQFGGFATTFVGPSTAGRTSSNHLATYVPGLNFHGEFSRGIVALLTEYVTAARSFNPGDLLFNGHGAVPAAMHAELDLNFTVGRYPLTVGGAYDRSWDALPLNLPQQSIFAVLSTSLWKNTAQKLEYRHDINYSVAPNSSVGGGGNGNINNLLPVPGANIGGSQDIVTLLFGVYF